MPIVAVAAAVCVLLAVRAFRVPDCAAYVEVHLAELATAGRCVRVEGLAHLRATLVHGEDWYVVPLLANVEGRDVQLLVRSRRRPSDRVDVEEMTVEGTLARATPKTVPLGSGEQVGTLGYTFAEPLYVVIADRIVGGEGSWTDAKGGP